MSERDLLLLAEARDLAASGVAARLRKQAHLSQADIAATVGVTTSCISRWESGERRPHGPAAVRWVRLLRRLERSHAS